MAENKKKDGKYYLNKKYEAEVEKNKELQSTVEKQAAEISKLNWEIHNAETRRINERVAHEREVDELFEHMGWFRRLTWRFDHAEKE